MFVCNITKTFHLFLYNLWSFPKNGKEFYSYRPGKLTPITVHSLPGINVDVSVGMIFISMILLNVNLCQVDQSNIRQVSFCFSGRNSPSGFLLIYYDDFGNSCVLFQVTLFHLKLFPINLNTKIQKYKNTNTKIQIQKIQIQNTQIHKYSIWRSARKTQHVVYFWKEDFSRISKIIIPCAE